MRQQPSSAAFPESADPRVRERRNSESWVRSPLKLPGPSGCWLDDGLAGLKFQGRCWGFTSQAGFAQRNEPGCASKSTDVEFSMAQLMPGPTASAIVSTAMFASFAPIVSAVRADRSMASLGKRGISTLGMANISQRLEVTGQSLTKGLTTYSRLPKLTCHVIAIA